MRGSLNKIILSPRVIKSARVDFKSKNKQRDALRRCTGMEPTPTNNSPQSKHSMKWICCEFRDARQPLWIMISFHPFCHGNFSHGLPISNGNRKGVLSGSQWWDQPQKPNQLDPLIFLISTKRLEWKSLQTTHNQQKCLSSSCFDIWMDEFHLCAEALHEFDLWRLFWWLSAGSSRWDWPHGMHKHCQCLPSFSFSFWLSTIKSNAQMCFCAQTHTDSTSVTSGDCFGESPLTAGWVAEIHRCEWNIHLTFFGHTQCQALEFHLGCQSGVCCTSRCQGAFLELLNTENQQLVIVHIELELLSSSCSLEPSVSVDVCILLSLLLLLLHGVVGGWFEFSELAQQNFFLSRERKFFLSLLGVCKQNELCSIACF